MPVCPGAENCIVMQGVGQILIFISKQGEFEEPGSGKSSGGRLGYKWKHFVQTGLQGHFHSELLTPPRAAGLLFGSTFSSSAINCLSS